MVIVHTIRKISPVAGIWCMKGETGQPAETHAITGTTTRAVKEQYTRDNGVCVAISVIPNRPIIVYLRNG